MIKIVLLKLKGKFYRTAIRPAMLYGTECWAVKSQQENKLNVAEMRMLQWRVDILGMIGLGMSALERESWGSASCKEDGRILP